MNTVTALLTNHAYGYPYKGNPRRKKPTVLACLHQTSGTGTAMQERNYANRANSGGPSATCYIDKDGTVVRALDPKTCAAWSQGDIQSPDTSIPTVKAMVAAKAQGFNPNEFVYESIEVCGRGTNPYSAAQTEAVCQLIAAASKALGLPVTRATVLTHRDINGVSRASDPWPSTTREAKVAAIIARANAILNPPPAVVLYTVVSGDTLSGIASSHGLTLAALLAFPENAKYRANPSLIHVGDVVRVK